MMDSRLVALGIKTANLSDLLRGNIPSNRGEGSKAAALLDLVREAHAMNFESRFQIKHPSAAASYLVGKLQGKTEEVFGVLSLNSHSELLADSIISMGTSISCQISPREVFREALRQGATAVIGYHNHPSGDPTPSIEDVFLTRRLRSVGAELSIQLADHMVIGSHRWYSFRAVEGWDQPREALKRHTKTNRKSPSKEDRSPSTELKTNAQIEQFLPGFIEAGLEDTPDLRASIRRVLLARTSSTKEASAKKSSCNSTKF